MSEYHRVGPWYCVGCGGARSLEDFGQPCRCGSFAMACDEEHRFTLASLERMAAAFHAEVEEIREAQE